MKSLKEFYENLYNKKKMEGYKKTVEYRRKDFIHKYLLFFLNPHKNTRHEIVNKTLLPQKRYLDVGCGGGESTVSYGSLEKFEEIYGVDISKSAVSEAKEFGIDARLVDVNHEVLPFPDNFFDVITCVAVIEHLIEPHHILKEMKRVLRPGGEMILGTVNVASFSNRMRILFGYRPRTSFDDGWDGGHLLYFTPRELRDLLSQYDFKVVDQYATGNMEFLRKLLFNLTGEFIFKCISIK